MISSLLAQAWTAPTIDWHAIAPELVLIAGINLVLLIDLWLDESKKWAMATLTGFVCFSSGNASMRFPLCRLPCRGIELSSPARLRLRF